MRTDLPHGDVSAGARLVAPDGTVTRVYDRAPDVETVAWPAGLDRLEPDDGTAIGAILTDCPSVRVVDGSSLRFRLDADGQPVSVALWRNLRGWPAEAPYRSIGVEPMLGAAFDLATAGRGEAAVVGFSGSCEWRLTVTA
ncbi:hypothetical protein SAMN05443668_105268 [Cryptosporangium aurantiacum]|uniref:Galactose mutarotase n=1 Tax=Cryptosporangium aurantiacum TaxID=134849 RepID=A0A1M7QS10_9ACTN|nr:hypothetical protein SAMN05443668_105268 [Cryptosporangium aurantiacum]